MITSLVRKREMVLKKELMIQLYKEEHISRDNSNEI